MLKVQEKYSQVSYINPVNKLATHIFVVFLLIWDNDEFCLN